LTIAFRVANMGHVAESEFHRFVQAIGAVAAMAHG
jgi:hypothetical protein